MDSESRSRNSEVWVAKKQRQGVRLYGKNVSPEKEMNPVNNSMWFMCACVSGEKEDVGVR